MVKFLDLNQQYHFLKQEMDAAIADVIAASSYVGGDTLVEFEQAFADFQDAGCCVGVGNGTDAIEIALEALALPAGSEVIVPANSFIASAEAVTRAGHRVVFCEPCERSYTVDISDAAARVTPRTAAIVCVHLYGHPCEMNKIQELADAHGLKVLEDSAQAHGAEYGGRRVGAIGDVGAFSFYPGKNLGAYGDGGAVVTDDMELGRMCRMIANHGRLGKYDHQFEGRNSRLDGLQAAILRVKLAHLDSWIERRNAVAREYFAGLGEIAELTLPHVASNVRHAFHLFVVRCDRRDALRAHLAADGIESGIHYPIALPDLAAYAYLRGPDSPVRASVLAPTLLSLPMGEHLTSFDVEQVIASVRRFFD